MGAVAALLLPACDAESRDEARPLAAGDLVSYPADAAFAAHLSPRLLEELKPSRWRIETVDPAFDPASLLFPGETGWAFQACAFRVPLSGRIHLKLTEGRRDELIAEARPEVEDGSVLVWGYRAWEAAGKREGEFVLAHCRKTAIEIVLRESLSRSAMPPPPSADRFVEDGWRSPPGFVESDCEDDETIEMDIGDKLLLGAYSWNGQLSALTAIALSYEIENTTIHMTLPEHDDVSLWPEPVWFLEATF